MGDLSCGEPDADVVPLTSLRLVNGHARHQGPRRSQTSSQCSKAVNLPLLVIARAGPGPSSGSEILYSTPQVVERLGLGVVCAANESFHDSS
jgi:hypothetical protein